MKKRYKLDEIDCANCAMKLEEALRSIEGVTSVKVNFMTQKLTLEAGDETFDQVEKSVLSAARRMEPDMKVTALHGR